MFSIHVHLCFAAASVLNACSILQDEDFVAEKDDSGSPTDVSEGEDSDASDNGGEKEVYTSLHFLLILGVHCQVSTFSSSLVLLPIQKLVKKGPEKEPLAFPKEATSRKRTRAKDGEEDGVRKKKQKKKKDPNAPKKPLSAFMFFSKAEREVGISILFLKKKYHQLSVFHLKLPALKLHMYITISY